MPQVEQLMVIEPFGEYAFGDRITESAAMKRALSQHPHHVVREVVDAEAEAQDEKEKPAGAKKSRSASE